MSVKWYFELTLKCDVKDCKNNRKLVTRIGSLLRSPKQLENVAISEGWNLSLYGITLCPDCNEKIKRYLKEKIEAIK